MMDYSLNSISSLNIWTSQLQREKANEGVQFRLKMSLNQQRTLSPLEISSYSMSNTFCIHGWVIFNLYFICRFNTNYIVCKWSLVVICEKFGRWWGSFYHDELWWMIIEYYIMHEWNCVFLCYLFKLFKT